MKDLSDIFEIQKTCEYKGEVYHVRDNGYVFRFRKSNKRKRPLDEIWTNGKINKQRGYLSLSSEAVHRIVATAFHKKPSHKHVVDHIDTNKQNNRPENLRWVTRLENILLNPITLKRIIYKYGSIDKFFENPSSPKDGQLEQTYSWMRAVTKEEAETCLNNLENWAKQDKIPRGGQLGDWIFRKINSDAESESTNYIKSMTPNPAQERVFLNDKPNEFPCTPKIIEANPLKTYYNNMKEGDVFFRNNNRQYVVVKREFSKDKKSILVLTRADYKYKENNDGEQVAIPISNIKDEVSYDDLPHSINYVNYNNNLYVHSREKGFLPKEYLEEIFDDYTR